MINRKNLTRESGSFNPFALAVATVAFYAVMMVSTAVVAPAAATSGAPAGSTATPAVIADGSGYLPAQYVNQGTQIEPVRDYTY